MPKPTKGARPGRQRPRTRSCSSRTSRSRSSSTARSRPPRRRRASCVRTPSSLVTKAKKGDLRNRRQVLQVITDKSVVHTLFTEIGAALREPSGWLHPYHQDR